MKTVSRFEADLLHILHGFFGRLPADSLQKLVKAETHCPKCLSQNAVELVKDTLRKGMTQFLAEQGGWKRERFLRNEAISAGRLWDRTPPAELGLTFSKHALQFLMWITANNPTESRMKPAPKIEELTTGDWLLFYLAYESLKKTEQETALLKQIPFQQHALIGLCNLMHYEKANITTGNLTPWFTNQGASVLEALQQQLANRWVELEQEKSKITKAETVKQVGSLQFYWMNQWFDAAEQIERRDLCRFFLIAMKEVLRRGESSSQATYAKLYSQIQVDHLKLSERFEVYQSAAASLQLLKRLDQWNREARGIGFYDEGYAASQLWKSDWEELAGDQLYEEAQTQLRNLEPLSNASKKNPHETKTASSSN